ncbi:hypothetical protein F5X96DRAFT_628173 [Biscogniauxia mediterranea]|nr:hypothetical protein F5X96DRAFT_628173 [Biscogniauxia mediterranea]
MVTGARPRSGVPRAADTCTYSLFTTVFVAKVRGLCVRGQVFAPSLPPCSATWFGVKPSLEKKIHKQFSKLLWGAVGVQECQRESLDHLSKPGTRTELEVISLPRAVVWNCVDLLCWFHNFKEPEWSLSLPSLREVNTVTPPRPAPGSPGS